MNPLTLTPTPAEVAVARTLANTFTGIAWWETDESLAAYANRAVETAPRPDDHDPVHSCGWVEHGCPACLPWSRTIVTRLLYVHLDRMRDTDRALYGPEVTQAHDPAVAVAS